jgi:glutamate carboxypeptidase
VVVMQDEQIADWLGGQHEAMVALLRTIVNVDSNSYDKHGIDAVGEVLHRFLLAHGASVEVIEQPRHGDVLRASAPWTGPAEKAGGNVLLMGHRDTVVPDGEAGRRPFTVRGGRTYGPGVADMKGGLVMNCFVLAAFARFGGLPTPVVGLFTGDEEIGSPEGRMVIEAETRGARAVFNSEPGRRSGAVVTGARAACS